MPRLLLVGLDEPQIAELKSRLGVPVVAHPTLPKIVVRGRRLWVEPVVGAWLVPIDAVVFHGIFEDDHDFLAALALWGGPCFPNARGLMDCRLRLPCLVRAQGLTRFPVADRGFASRGADFEAAGEWVAKWGNWHCGENKFRFAGRWSPEQDSIVEPYLTGHAVRVLVVGDEARQIRLGGDDWLQSIHHESADFMPLDPELGDDTRSIAAGVELQVAACDYLVGDDGRNYLLELNHVPNVTRFPEAWRLWSDAVVNWTKANGLISGQER